ncbi:hypothetical protein NDU88_002561 [Pleurodeles waltl]|uniref:Secreted protein n=1 Tax=Pleurodeles waltl TaxID=8319 RepID=A0AAV7VEW4_PLEWA|nr:hypothetical protein NDU88_002561 [Pleurodeles waltl]
MQPHLYSCVGLLRLATTTLVANHAEQHGSKKWGANRSGGGQAKGGSSRFGLGPGTRGLLGPQLGRKDGVGVAQSDSGSAAVRQRRRCGVRHMGERSCWCRKRRDAAVDGELGRDLRLLDWRQRGVE